MKVNVRGKNKFEPTQSIRDYAQKKLSRFDQYYKNADNLEARVLCCVYENYESVEVTIPTKNITLRVDVKADTIMAAIDLAVDKLETQMRRHKSKIEKSIKRRTGIKGQLLQDAELNTDKIEPIENIKRLVKEKSFELVTMDREEAILEMEISGHDFYVYLDNKTHKTCIVYLRQDGNYGVIETK